MPPEYLLDIIAVTYLQNHELKCFIESILAQTVREWKLTVIHDGPSVPFVMTMEKYLLEDRIDFDITQERYNDWGHSLRKIGLDYLVHSPSKYTLITNADDYFAPIFVKEMCCGDEDLVYCNCAHHHWNYQARESQLRRKAIDISCCVVKTEIVKEVGWNHFEYAADWFFLNDIMTKHPGLSVRKVPKVLVMKN